MNSNASGIGNSGVNSSVSDGGATVSKQNVCKENWNGSIPVRLSLAPTSLSCSTMPLPYHCMLSRMTFLHIGLKPYVLRLYKFAPQLFFTQNNQCSTTEEEDPENTAQDSNNHRKHVSVESHDETDENKVKQQQENAPGDEIGDKNNSKSISGDDNPSDSQSNNNPKGNGKNKYNTEVDDSNCNNEDAAIDDPVCWFEDEETGLALRWHLFVGVLWDMLQQQPLSRKKRRLPWNIRVHFTSYPQSELLQFSDHTPVSVTVQKFYNNSLKQALFLQFGTSKKAMSISKSDHVQIWESIVSSKWVSYQEINHDLQVRIPIDTQVPKETKISPSIYEATNVNDIPSADNCTNDHYKILQNVPVRIMVDGKPFLQKKCPPFVDLTSDDQYLNHDINYPFNNHDDQDPPPPDCCQRPPLRRGLQCCR